jgi:precorrin-6A/cobalt-precorrin-6A reductase
MGRSSAVPDSSKPHVLILGGTGEAAALARSLIDDLGDRLEITTSLAGRTREPAALPGQVRSGGFGGAVALADYMRDHRIAAVIDATHPFAAQISTNAATACEVANVPRLVLSRPCWKAQAGDNWVEFENFEEAVRGLPRLGERVFLTVGAQELNSFAALTELWFLVRLVETPADPIVLSNYQMITGRGPFSFAGELALMESHKIDILVTKASGGEATVAKLAAARQLGLPVAMVCRPPAPPGPAVDDVTAAADWVIRLLGT